MQGRDDHEPDIVDALFEGAKKSLNPQELAEIIGVSRQTVLNWIESKNIPAYRFSGSSRWILFRDEIKELLRNSSNGFTWSEGEGPAGPEEPEGAEKE